jgi:LysM repeat protein
VSTTSPEYKQLYENRQIGRWLDNDTFDSQVPLDEVTVRPQSYSMESLRDFTKAAMYGAPENLMKLEQVPTAALAETAAMLTGKPYDFSNINPNFGQWGSNQRDLSILGYENPEGFMQNAVNFGLSAIDPSMIAGGANMLRKPLQKALQKTGKYLTEETALHTLHKAKNFKEALGTLSGIPTERSLPRLSPEELKSYRQVQEIGRMRATNKPISEQYTYALQQNIPDEHFQKVFGKSKTEIEQILPSVVEQEASRSHINIRERFNLERGPRRRRSSSDVTIDGTSNGIDIRTSSPEEIQEFANRMGMSVDELTELAQSTLPQQTRDEVIRHRLTDYGSDADIERLSEIRYNSNEFNPISEELLINLRNPSNVLINSNRPRLNLLETARDDWQRYVDNKVPTSEVINNKFANIVSEYPYHKGPVLQNVPSLSLASSGNLKNVSKKVGDQSVSGISSGDVFTGSLNTSHNSYLPQIKQVFKYTDGTPQFLGYKPMNHLGFLSDFNYSQDDIAKYLNTEIDQQISRGVIPKNIQRPYVRNEYTVNLPHYGIKQFQEGGIVEDDMGYLNPDNHGKPVRVNSNVITMEGVYEPLLGISDTGDTKLMEPGKNYKFKGKKVTEFPVAEDGGKFMNQYTINQGDTLSKISKETGYSVEQLAKLNNIEDPNKIYAGEKLTIPYKFDKSLSIKEIPQEHHKNIVIDDYSKSFNYLVQGDKVYYTKKNSDNWVDISDNNKAKGNLYAHLDDKYGMKGYSDYEKSLRKLISDNAYNYDKSYNQRYSTAPTNYVQAPEKSPKSLELKGVSINSFNNSFKQPKALPVVNDPFGRLSRMVPNHQAKEESNPIVNYLSDMYDKASDFATDVKEGVSEYVDLGANWLDRQYNKQSDAREESSYIKEPIITNSEYSINQPIITGDTLRIDDDRYYLPEVMDLNEFTFKNRNRNELTPIETDAASITAFNPFQEYDAVKKSNYPKDANFIGIDPTGNFKSGSLDQFGPTDKLSRVFKNNVESFVTDKNNEMKFVKWNDNTIINGKRVGNKDNPNSYVPLVNVIDDDGNKIVGTLNLLVKSPKELGTFGQITGGRLIFKQGNKQILVSGSVKDIKSQFDKLSKNGPVEVLTLDNGSYSRGLRTYDKQLSPQQLQEYDRQNVSGGHFLYSTGQKTFNKYPEERFQTPNIRTKKDESYKQGHPLKNELQGVVLHQTAYSEKDLSKVHKQFMTPNKNSAHVLIGYDGERRIYADPEQVTFHGGVSSFKGRENVNDFMLGLEFQGVAGKDKLTDEQIESAVEYLTPIIRKYNIPIEHITSHAAVAPGRKHDVSNDDLEKIYKIIRDRLYNKKRNGGIVGINQLDAQPMKKLNQLTNFTNNPDKTNWLDKYN